MNSFKIWLESTDVGFTTVSGGGYGHEIENDPFIPDQAHIQHALNISSRIKGFFPAFRQVIKDGAILNAFSNALKQGFPKNGEPFNYQKQNWLNDEIQAYIAKVVGMDFRQVEPYCEPLRQSFVQIYNNLKGWDDKQQSQSWPGLN